jgi:carbonyl reductase 1
MTDTFLPLIAPNGRIVMVGSGSGPGYVGKLPEEEKAFWRNTNCTWKELAAQVEAKKAGASSKYGLSKAALHLLTMIYAKEHKNIMWSAISPGFIDTKLTKGYGAKLTPKEGTVSIRHCLFNELPQSGLYWGSDGKRSPVHVTRDPGTPEYTGEY